MGMPLVADIPAPMLDCARHLLPDIKTLSPRLVRDCLHHASAATIAQQDVQV